MRTTRIVSLLAAAALSSAALAMPFAPALAAEKPTACSQQERQVAKAEDKLAALTAKLAVQKKASSTAGSEQAQENAAAKAEKTKKAKKAQVQRLAKAEARLAECTAAQPTVG
jgi:hypothetical protein